MKAKTCMFCGRSFTGGTTSTIDYKNVRVTEHLITTLQGADICEDCKGRYIKAIQQVYDDVQREKHVIPDLIAMTSATGIRSAMEHLPEGYAIDYFNALLDLDDILLDDDMYMLINRIGYREAYKRLYSWQIAAIVQRDLKDVVVHIASVVPKDEWREDMKMFDKYGVDKCRINLLMGKHTDPFLK